MDDRYTQHMNGPMPMSFYTTETSSGASVINVGGNMIMRDQNMSIGASHYQLYPDFVVADAGYHGRTTRTACLESTRSSIIAKLLGWRDDVNSSFFCWLSGPAGFGKSTIAQTVAEICAKDKMLIASYFFARGAGGRSELSRFITTLAFQITISVPEVKQFVENAFRADPSIVHQSIANQLHRLVFEPLLAVSSVNSPPRTHVIVIDALDECNDRVAVQDFLNALASACSGPWLPLRWLFTSREHIQETYSSNAIRVMTTSFALEDFDAHSDIHKFLIYRFSDIIKNKARLFRGVPMPWPPTRDLAALVRKSGGLFIFAATLVHFVTDGKAAPDKKLQTVLALHTGLYPLYEQVLRDVPEIECFRRVLTTLMLIKEQPSISTLAELLELDNQDVLHALMAIQTIIHIPADDESPVQLNHTSLRDFLIDENRSKDLFIDPAVAHCTLAVDCVKLMNRTLRQDEFPTDAAPKYAALHWLDHLVDGHGSTDLLPTMLNILTDFSLSLTCDAWINTTLLNRIVGKTRNNLNSLCRVYEQLTGGDIMAQALTRILTRLKTDVRLFALKIETDE